MNTGQNYDYSAAQVQAQMAGGKLARSNSTSALDRTIARAEDIARSLSVSFDRLSSEMDRIHGAQPAEAPQGLAADCLTSGALDKLDHAMERLEIFAKKIDAEVTRATKI